MDQMQQMVEIYIRMAAAAAPADKNKVRLRHMIRMHQSAMAILCTLYAMHC